MSPAGAAREPPGPLAGTRPHSGRRARGSFQKAMAPAATMAAMVSSAAVKGSTPAYLASDAARPVVHCINAMPRNMAMVKSDSARPRMCSG